MGAGGITAIVVKVAAQKTAYVVIDGNNMISGLREEVLSALAAEGFDESEVFTTDTHAVSAVILGKRGYHPVGEAMDHERLMCRIKEAAVTAASRLEPCKAGCLSFVVPRVRVIGKSRIHSLTTLVDTALQRAKQIVVPVFALEGLLLVLFLAVL
jgi:putative membrane protein